METIYSSEQLIEELLTTTYDGSHSTRQKHVLREALRSLVRLAKAEQMLEIRTDVKKITQLPDDTVHPYREVD